MSEALEQFLVVDLPVHLADDYPSWLISRLSQKLGSHIVTLNSEMVMQAEQNPNLASVIRQADLVIPDGSGVVLYLRLYGKSLRRCPGIELAESLLKQVGELGQPYSVFFYGGAPGVAESAAAFWQPQVHNLAIAGTQHGYINAEEEEKLKHTLKTLQPSLILVGLGAPRQEFWIAQNRHLCPQAIWIGVGGSLDIWSGTKARAPLWFRNNHLEWLYRLYQEPHRWRRMLALPQFAIRALLHRLQPVKCA